MDVISLPAFIPWILVAEDMEVGTVFPDGALTREDTVAGI